MLMQHSKFEHSIWPSILAPLLAGLLAAAVYNSRGLAAPASPPPSRQVYVVSDHEGYGLIDCISQKRECGKVVADSWCEAHGHGRALAFGGADDVTGAIADSNTPRPPAGVALVTCQD
jgi:hypothetical protein